MPRIVQKLRADIQHNILQICFFSRIYNTKDKKKPVFCPTTKRLEAFGTMRSDFLVCGIGNDARGFLHNKGAVVSEAVVLFGQARPFQGGAIALEALSETTNGDADSVVMNPACQSPKFFEA